MSERLEPGVTKITERYEVVVTLTPEQYEAIKRNAEWDGFSIAGYLVAAAEGRTRKGC